MESEASNYKIHVTGYSGDLYDVMNYGTIEGAHFHDGMNFSTYDRDNDRSTLSRFSCASHFGGGWWYNDCFRVFLNGIYDYFFWLLDIDENSRQCTVSRMMMMKKD